MVRPNRLIPENEQRKDTMNAQPRKPIVHKGGTTYFTKKFERLLFFILTMVMLGWGVGEKILHYFGQ